MHDDQVVAVALFQLVDRDVEEEPVMAVAEVQPGHREAWHLFDAKSCERLPAVGPDDHCGAHLGGLGCALENLDLVPRFDQPDGGGEAADTRSRDEGLHANLSIVPTLNFTFMAIPLEDFGRTKHKSSRVIFGGASLSSASQAAADKTLEVLLQHGINHIDVAASYGDAELRVKPWLKREPGHFFLATKTDERGAKEAREQLHRSLDRLGVDHVDLWQLHNLADPIEWDIALSPGGAIEAAVEAREQGLVRWIGVTGHGSQIAATHRRSLERFDFDSVLLPYNFVTMQSAYYAENFDALVATCKQRNTAVQTIKSIAQSPWLGRRKTRTTWYEPLEAQPDIDLAVWWVLGRTGVFLNTVGDVDLLPKVLDAAGRFEHRPSESEMKSLVERSAAKPLFV
jgi:aryl-alcohol dehydrogenase-like predicted oxidoreductase